MKLENVLAVYTTPRTNEQKSTLNLVKKTLKKFKINFSLANRDKLSKAQFRNRNLIIAVGGDGTFLRAAQFVGKQLIFGVNSDVKDKEGFFMKSNRNDFDKKFRRIANSQFKIKKLSRLEANMDNKKLDTLALNEFFIGPKKSYHAAKYIINFGNRKELQKSSGILITTPTGSYAWAKSCHGKALPLKSTNYQFVVREPYQGRVFKNYKLIYRVLGRNQKITVTSKMLDGILIADSVGKEHSFKNGSKATFKISNKHLNAIWL